MRVTAHIVISRTKEILIEGDTGVFDRRLKYEGGHKRLASIGFWLSNWKYIKNHAKPHKKSWVFIPWTSCLMIETEEIKEG